MRMDFRSHQLLVLIVYGSSGSGDVCGLWYNNSLTIAYPCKQIV